MDRDVAARTATRHGEHTGQLAALEARINALEARPIVKWAGTSKNDGVVRRAGDLIMWNGGLWLVLRDTSCPSRTLRARTGPFARPVLDQSHWLFCILDGSNPKKVWGGHRIASARTCLCLTRTDYVDVRRTFSARGPFGP